MLHPDLLGFNFSLKFLHFEMKKELDFSNIREAFFQTVSNRIYDTAYDKVYSIDDLKL